MILLDWNRVESQNVRQSLDKGKPPNAALANDRNLPMADTQMTPGLAMWSSDEPHRRGHVTVTGSIIAVPLCCVCPAAAMTASSLFPPLSEKIIQP